jgi:hypothetical protein
MNNNGEIIIYQTDDGETKIEVRMIDETVWLSQEQMAELFQTTKSNVSMHISNVFDEGELQSDDTIKKFRISEFNKKPTNFYNLDVVISVGYRVKSHRGTAFRIWATSILREYIKKGFAMDDDRLMENGNYFDELLSRIRNIRSSEKMFYRKVLEIYATSIDYDPRAKATQDFFKIVQNKMHYSAHGNTAAEVIYGRADAEEPFMGLTSWRGFIPTKSDAEIAKNYLSEEEIDLLNRIVNLYLDFAELQAKSRTPMYMKDWINKLDEFLRISGRDVLTNAGLVSHKAAMEKANAEYEKFSERISTKLSPVEKHFLEAVNHAKELSDKQKDGK